MKELHSYYLHSYGELREASVIPIDITNPDDDSPNDLFCFMQGELIPKFKSSNQEEQ